MIREREPYLRPPLLTVRLSHGQETLVVSERSVSQLSRLGIDYRRTMSHEVLTTVGHRSPGPVIAASGEIRWRESDSKSGHGGPQSPATQNPNMCTPFWEKFQNDDLISQQLEEGPPKTLRI